MLSKKRMSEIVEYFTEFHESKSFEEICAETGLKGKELAAFIEYLQEASCEVVAKEGFVRLANPNQRTKLSELLNNYTNEQSEVMTLEDLENESLGLESIVFPEPVNELNARGELVEFIEEAISGGLCLKLNLANSKTFVINPHRVVFIDGVLSIVGEAARDNCLRSIEVDQVLSVSEVEERKEKVFSPFEVEDFLSSIRAVEESEMRLVLKVYSQENFNSNLKNHHLGNQYMVTNAEGDYIWAASIEPSEEIFQWVYELGSDVEILDPTAFKKDFLHYCEARLKKLA